jgi:hypothetical protein
MEYRAFYIILFSVIIPKWKRVTGFPIVPPGAPGCGFCVPQGEFPAGPTIRRKNASPSLRGRDFEHEDEHVHERE